MKLTLQSCTVRSWRAGDAEPIARYADNKKIWLNLRDAFPHPYTIHDARDFIASMRHFPAGRVTWSGCGILPPEKGSAQNAIRAVHVHVRCDAFVRFEVAQPRPCNSAIS
jgi:hypothetical protein